jgi:hypothetical protein
MNATRPGKEGEAAEARMRVALGNRRRWSSLAGSILAGVLVGLFVWLGGAGNKLPRDAVAHVAGERGSMVRTSRPVDGQLLSDVLHQGGARWTAAPASVSYARACDFHGRRVAHLVLQTASGPVAVLLLREEHVRRPAAFRRDGFEGVVEPVGAGSMVVIGGPRTDVAAAAASIAASIEWAGP